MKQLKDPFEVAFEEQEENESPPESPPVVAPPDAIESHPQTQNRGHVQSESAAHLVIDADNAQELDDGDAVENANIGVTNMMKPSKSRVAAARKTREEEDEEEEEEEDNMMEMELAKLPNTGNPRKMAKMQSILSHFTGEQMSRYESFRRSGFQKSNMKRLLASITGSAKISIPMTIVVSGIAKMFVGDLVEGARFVMTERKENGPIRPCHIREAYRRLKLEGKVPKRSVPRLFRFQLKDPLRNKKGLAADSQRRKTSPLGIVFATGEVFSASMVEEQKASVKAGSENNMDVVVETF